MTTYKPTTYYKRRIIPGDEKLVKIKFDFSFYDESKQRIDNIDNDVEFLELEINNNFSCKIIDFQFKNQNLTKLKKLYIKGGVDGGYVTLNGLNFISELESSIEELEINEPTSQVDLHFLKNFHRLKKLFINGSSLSCINETILLPKLPNNLEMLVIHDYPSHKVFKVKPKLELEINNITHLELYCVDYLNFHINNNKLETLVIENGICTDFHEFSKLKNLKILNLPYNNIKDSSQFSNIRSLKELYVHHNSIEDFNLDDFLFLDKFELYDNKFTKEKKELYRDFIKNNNKKWLCW